MFVTCPSKPYLPWYDPVIIYAEEYKLCASLSGNVLVFLVSVTPEWLIIILGVKDAVTRR